MNGFNFAGSIGGGRSGDRFGGSVGPSEGAAAPSGVLVADAGTTAVNGTYLYWGENSGKPSYTPDGAGDPGDAGVFATEVEWRISFGGQNLYTSSDDVAFPWLVTTWVETGGDPPVPVVTEVS